MEELVNLVIEWGKSRGILRSSDPTTEFLKTISEAGELADNVAKGRDIKDDVGDVLVTLILGSKLQGSDASLSTIKAPVTGDSRLENQSPAFLVMRLVRCLGELSKPVSDLAASIETAREMRALGAAVQINTDNYNSKHADHLLQVLQVLQVLADGQGYTLQECLAHAYQTISARKGRMVNGTFVKEGDNG